MMKNRLLRCALRPSKWVTLVVTTTGAAANCVQLQHSLHKGRCRLKAADADIWLAYVLAYVFVFPVHMITFKRQADEDSCNFCSISLHFSKFRVRVTENITKDDTFNKSY